MELGKFTGPKNKLEPAPQGAVWVNKPGPLNQWTLLTLDEIDGMPVEDFMKYYGGGKRVAGARDHKRYHSKFWAPATTIAANPAGISFFQTTNGDEETSLDGGTSITVTDYISNMADKGRMELNATFIIYALGIRVDIPHREFNAFSADLQPVSAVVTSTDTSSATAHQLIIDRSAVFELIKGSGVSVDTVAQGSLFDFPSKGGPGGIASGNTVEGVATNGNGFLNYLDEVVVLESGRQFRLLMHTYNAMLNVLNVEVRPILYGALLSA
jgi:hypothetical protein